MSAVVRPFFAFSVRGGGNDRTFAHRLGLLHTIARAQVIGRPALQTWRDFFGGAVVLGLALCCGFAKLQQKNKNADHLIEVERCENTKTQQNEQRGTPRSLLNVAEMLGLQQIRYKTQKETVIAKDC